MTAPASAAGGNWDASILYTGLNTPNQYKNLSAANGGLVTVTESPVHVYASNALVQGVPWASLNLWAGAAGSTMSTGAPYTANDFYYALGSCEVTDRCRVIAVAFEVHNTTAPVYQSGSLTVAALPDVCDDSGMILYQDSAGAYFPTWKQMTRGCVQASTVSALQAVPGSQTWSASEGVYAIPRMAKIPRDIESLLQTTNTHTAPLAHANTHVPVFYGSDGKIATPEPTGSGGDVEAAHICGITACAPSSFSPLQVMLSGLSNQSSITVTFRTVVEYFPSVTSYDLPLASPSPFFDPLAFEVYGKTVQTAPYAVPVDQNAAGDYFRKVMAILSESASLLAPMFGTYAPLVTAGSALAGALSRVGGKPIKRDEAGARARPTKRR